MLEANLLHIGYEKTLFSNPITGLWKKGDIVVVLGDNGIGKSTFLKTLANLQKPISGNVKCSASRVGWVDSSILKGVYLSLYDFLSFGVHFEEEDLNYWLNRFEIGLDLNIFIDEISDGQFRKLCIIRQLLKNPEILFLDEPTVYLDVKSKIQLTHVVKELSVNCLIFCSTHDLHFANEIKTSTIKF